MNQGASKRCGVGGSKEEKKDKCETSEPLGWTTEDRHVNGPRDRRHNMGGVAKLEEKLDLLPLHPTKFSPV
jgi:hypothetical protein